ncbi:unnamed protein product [Caretta caretta]
MMASLTLERPGPANWHFNNRLLEEVGFVVSFHEFWLAWQGQGCAFLSAQLWSGVWKVCTRLICCDYTWGTSWLSDVVIEQLEWEVLELERRLIAIPLWSVPGEA